MKSPLRTKEIILCAFLFLLLLPLKAGAETIGVVLSAGVPYYQEMHDALAAKLSKEGYSERVKFLIQKPSPNPLSWSNAARKLIASDVDLIVTYGYGATAAALRERADIPIVYAGAHMPFLGGKRAQNVTGMYIKLPVSSVLRYIRATAEIKDLSVLFSSSEDDSAAQLSEIRAMAQKYGFQITAIDVQSAADISSYLGRSKTDAYFVTSSAVVNSALHTIVSLSRTKKIPTGAFFTRGDVSALITLMADPKEQGEGAAEKLIEVLKGKPPGAIQPSASKNTELIFNMKEAREMGIKIPMDLVTEATRIIN